MEVRVGILTVSDRAVSGKYEDKSGPLIAEILSQRSAWLISRQAIVPDEINEIVSIITNWCQEGLDLILTTGGTGFAPRDVTPEATLKVIEKQTPGITEAMRQESLKITPHAMLSRAVAGIRQGTLIINLPGSPKAVKENLNVLMPVLPHALELLKDEGGTETTHQMV
jgi:molybdenum cofactor synthesis domain-containing protein